MKLHNRNLTFLVADRKLKKVQDAGQIKKIAEANANAGSEGFFYKMADKMGGLTTHSELKKVEEVMYNKSTPMESKMKFEFADGSQFTVHNSIVVNTSVNGNGYYQYPTTFHSATTANGKKVQYPNEYTVKEAFNNSNKKTA